MARHNRQAKGVDQHGELWHVSYQPDWLSRVKISRMLPDGRRRSSVTLVENPADRARAEPGKVVRTRVRAGDGSAEFEISLEDRNDLVQEIVVVTRPRNGRDADRLEFVIRDGLEPPEG